MHRLFTEENRKKADRITKDLILSSHKKLKAEINEELKDATPQQLRDRIIKNEATLLSLVVAFSHVTAYLTTEVKTISDSHIQIIKSHKDFLTVSEKLRSEFRRINDEIKRASTFAKSKTPTTKH